MKQPPILITGCARSGTSMVAGSINLCGAFGGYMSGPNKNNEKGMFENAYMRDNVVKPHLRSIGADPLGQYPLPDVRNLAIPIAWASRVENIMETQGLKEDEAWFYKGAKMCLTWPIWHYAFPNARWVIVRRKTPDIIRSCQRTGFMRAFKDRATQMKVEAANEQAGWLWWVHQHEQRFIEMMEAGLNVKIVWPERMIHGDYTQMKETVEWCGLEWNNEIYDFISPKLWKGKK